MRPERPLEAIAPPPLPWLGLALVCLLLAGAALAEPAYRWVAVKASLGTRCFAVDLEAGRWAPMSQACLQDLEWQPLSHRTLACQADLDKSGLVGGGDVSRLLPLIGERCDPDEGPAP